VAPPFAFNHGADVELVRIGRQGIKVSLIDDVLEDPRGVAALGYAADYEQDRSNLYPGFRAPMPEGFSTAFRAWLAPILQRNGVLGERQTLDRDTSYFSFVATASRDLLPIQRIPHFDSADGSLLAAVIYLCDEQFSGTAFYRHRRTGYEEITKNNVSNYRLALNSDMETHGAPPNEYFAGDSTLFETLYSSELKFNRAIVYPAGVLHAARIARGFEPPRDRSQWRLTVTALLYVTG
jgi:hypothetical protein